MKFLSPEVPSHAAQKIKDLIDVNKLSVCISQLLFTLPILVGFALKKYILLAFAL